MLLITGATGFLGGHIVTELLAEGYELRVLIRNPENRKLPPWSNLVEIVPGDILDVMALEQAMQGVDQVIHAAAKVSFWRKEWSEIQRVNVEGTANIVNACLDAEVEKLVHVSSIAAVGNPGKGEIINEEVAWNPALVKSRYARSKRQAELEVYRGIAEGLHAVMINPAVILGPSTHWREGTPKVFYILDRGLRFYNPGANGFVGVQDVARACRLLLEQEVPDGERYLLSAENLSYHTLFTWVANALGKKPPRYKLPAIPTLWAGRVSEWISYLTGRPPIISLETMRSGLLSRRYDGSKITQLGLEYTPVRQVVQETAAVYLADKEKAKK